MKKLRRGLAMLLTVAMTLSATVVSFAEETAENNPSVPTIEWNELDSNDIENSSSDDELLLDDEFSYESIIGDEEDVVVYNLGTQKMIVGCNEELAEEVPWCYQLFESDGSYTIQLEEDAFFPYEIQFTYDGNTVEEWFETPESSVEIGGHVFYVNSECCDEEAITQIGVWIGDDYVAAYPEEKEFTDSSISTYSLLPLEERQVTLDLSGYGRYQLMNIRLSAILSGIAASVDNDNAVVWISTDTSDSEILQQDSTLDLLEKLGYRRNFTLVVGNAKQLDDNNIRYIVGVQNMAEDIFEEEVSVYTEKNGVRTEVTPNHVYFYSETDWDELSISLNGNLYQNGIYYLGGLQLLQNNAELGQFKIYKGQFENMEEIEAAVAEDSSIDVTDKLMATDMMQENAGYQITLDGTHFDESFTTVMEYGSEHYIREFELSLYLNNAGLGINSFACREEPYHGYSSKSDNDNVKTYTIHCGTTCSASDSHCLKLRYRTAGGNTNNAMVTKAVEGHYNSLEAAADVTDIKEELFVESWEDGGYEAVYSGSGKNFTIFAEGAVYKITVVAEGEYVPEQKVDAPKPGSRDTYFNVSGAAELHNCYTMPYEHDTYFDVGYQTVFYLDDVELSALKPTFSTGQGATIYSGHNGAAGTKQTSGETEADFTNGPVKYAAASESGTELKNYWVTFVKKHTGGPKLFVNGINGDDGTKREVFLTSAHDNLHDIFIANIGDQPLTGLKATLKYGNSIKLDDYWTIGGEGNDTLAAFTTTDKAVGSRYGELANVAKIRLLPNGEGEIEDELTISADGQEDVVIHLTGNAGDPRLTTDEIPEAVKYVPYAVQLLHNNKYDWNKVTMKIVSGSLPEGVVLKPNGEIYGVPKETGTFEFRVFMDNSYSGFMDQYATFTLVVNENTNENVDAATDSGYDVNQRIGIRVGNDDVVTEIKDQVFISNGDMGEFVGFWLNGEKLTEGTDYDKESGSTKITIRSQTFQNKAQKNSANTIAAEFRINGDEQKELRRTAQNFKLDISGNSGNSGGNGSGGSGSGGNGSGGSGSGGSGSTGGGSASSNQSSQNSGNKKPVVEQPVVEALTTIVETVEVPAVANEVTVETNALQTAWNNAVENEKQTEEKELIQIALKVTELEAESHDVKVVIPEEAINSVAREDNVSLKLYAGDLGSLTFSHVALESIADAGEGNIVVSLQRENSTVRLELVKGERILSQINSGVKIAFGGLDDGEVIVLIKADGVEEIVKKSVVKDGNVYALIDGSGTVKVVYNSKDFEDIAEADWFYDAIVFVNSRELFVGISDTEFAPTLAMSRAMAAAVLHRLENCEGAVATYNFKDVLPNQWYTNDIAWAESTGIISGYGEGLFGAEDKITVEQLAMILYRYANYIGIDTLERGKITKFEDANEISPWANDAVRWAVGTGLLNGDGTALNPKNEATRAQVAAVIMRFIENMVK